MNMSRKQWESTSRQYFELGRQDMSQRIDNALLATKGSASIEINLDPPKVVADPPKRKQSRKKRTP